LILIIGSPFWCKPVKLAWFDTRLCYTYRFEAIGESGNSYTLPEKFFSPYTYAFTKRDFAYITPQKHLLVNYGATKDPKLASALKKANSPEKIVQLENDLGEIRYSPGRAQIFDEFISRFVSNANRRQFRREYFQVVQPPADLWSSPGKKAFKGNDELRKVMVYQVTALFDDSNYTEMRKRLVREIDIPAIR